jgi:hypothetical protein
MHGTLDGRRRVCYEIDDYVKRGSRRSPSGCVGQRLQTGITNARTEGYNRLVKQVKRIAGGFGNPENSARRIRFHCTRKQRAATQISC